MRRDASASSLSRRMLSARDSDRPPAGERGVFILSSATAATASAAAAPISEIGVAEPRGAAGVPEARRTRASCECGQWAVGAEAAKGEL